jgi:hypothetical protein
MLLSYVIIVLPALFYCPGFNFSLVLVPALNERISFMGFVAFRSFCSPCRTMSRQLGVTPIHCKAFSPKFKKINALCLNYIRVCVCLSVFKSQDSAIGTATSYGLDDRGGRSSRPGILKNVHFFMSSRPALETTQLSIQWILGGFPHV